MLIKPHFGLLNLVGVWNVGRAPGRTKFEHFRGEIDVILELPVGALYPITDHVKDMLQLSYLIGQLIV